MKSWNLTFFCANSEGFAFMFKVSPAFHLVKLICSPRTYARVLSLSLDISQRLLLTLKLLLKV